MRCSAHPKRCSGSCRIRLVNNRCWNRELEARVLNVCEATLCHLPTNTNFERQNPEHLSFAFVLIYPAVLYRIVTRLCVFVFFCVRSYFQMVAFEFHLENIWASSVNVNKPILLLSRSCVFPVDKCSVFTCSRSVCMLINYTNQNAMSRSGQ